MLSVCVNRSVSCVCLSRADSVGIFPFVFSLLFLVLQFINPVVKVVGLSSATFYSIEHLNREKKNTHRHKTVKRNPHIRIWIGNKNAVVMVINFIQNTQPNSISNGILCKNRCRSVKLVVNHVIVTKLCRNSTIFERIFWI